MQFPLIIGLRRSRFYATALLAVHLLAMTALISVGWAWQATVPVCLLVFGSLAWGLCQLQRQEIALRLHKDGHLECRLSKNGDFEAADLRPNAVVHPLLTILRLDTQSGRQVVLVAPDSASPEERRHLRIWLQWCADFRSANAL